MFSLGHTEALRELAGVEGYYEPVINPPTLETYVVRARKCDTVLTDNALSRVAQHDHPVRVRRLARGSARLHLREEITADDVEVAADTVGESQ